MRVEGSCFEPKAMLRLPRLEKGLSVDRLEGAVGEEEAGAEVP